MELMAHVKSLFADLMSMTSKIIIKRPDIATKDNNEENIFNLEMYYAYRDIVNGEESITSYSTIPSSVLDKLVSWAKLDNNDLYKKAYPGTGSFYEYEVCESTDSGALEVINDSNTPTDMQIKQSSININVLVGTYVKKSSTPKKYYAFRAPTPADQVSAGSLWLQKIGKDRYTRIFSNSGNGKELRYSFTRNGVSTNYIPDNGTYKDSHNNVCTPYFEEFFMDEEEQPSVKDDYGNTISRIGTERYIYDDATDKYISITGSQSVTVYKRYYSCGFILASPAIIHENEYILKSEYEANTYKYSLTKSPFVSDGAGGFIDVLALDNPEEELPDITSSTPIYYLVNEVTKVAVGNITHNETNTIASFGNVSLVDTSVSGLYYFMESETGNYIYNGSNYVLAEETSDGIRYEKINAPNTIDRYSLSGGIYTRNPSGEYTYICEDYIVWYAQPIKAVVSGITNIGNLDKEYYPAAMQAMHDYVLENYCPPVDLEEHRVSLYLGETNPYYRMLNGLPSTDDEKVTAPKIDRLLINPSYLGDNTNPYVYELTDEEIETITENGMLESIKKLHPTAKYLEYLGRDRIDVIQARDAAPFDILRIQDVENDKHIELFKKSYVKAKGYILGRYYNPEIFHEFDQYIGYIGFLIMAYAICQCFAQSDDILVYDEYMDDKTINDIIKSYGFEGDFASLPTIYRKMVAKNILMLIKYRGTDDIYKIIYNICGITNYNIFKYDIINGEDAVTAIRRSVIDHEVDKTVPFADLINNDDLWKAGVDVVRALNFNKSSSKYIDMETYFDLSELTLNNSYLLNYLLDVSKTRDTMIDVPNVGIFKLFDLIVALFTIQSIKFGYTGTLPTSVASAATIYKFDLGAASTGNSAAKEILSSYASRLSGISRENINHLIDMINRNGSVYLPEKNDVTVRSFSDSYFASMREDSPNTNLNENSFYKEILELRSKAKNHIEYKCYNELLECIATSAITASNFKLDSTVWEPMYIGTYSRSISSSYDATKYTGTWSYGENLASTVDASLLNLTRYVSNEVTWNSSSANFVLAIGHEPPETIESDEHINLTKDNYYLKVSDGAESGIYSVVLYQRCTNALTYGMYLREQCKDLYDKIYTITSDNTYVINTYDSIFSVNANFIRVYKDSGKTIVDLGTDSNYTLQDTDSDGDIDLIILRDGTTLTYAQYYQLLKYNADKIYKLIIGRIESMMSSTQIRKNLVLSHESTTNIMQYLKLLINVFKSYNTDIRENKVIYTLDETSKNSVRLFDTIYFDMSLNKSMEINMYDEITDLLVESSPIV